MIVTGNAIENVTGNVTVSVIENVIANVIGIGIATAISMIVARTGISTSDLDWVDQEMIDQTTPIIAVMLRHNLNFLQDF